GTLPGALDHLGGQVHITGHHRIHHLLDLIQVGSGIDQGSQQHVSGNTGARIYPQAHAVKDTTRCSTGWPVLREAGTSISIWLTLPADAGGLASSRSSRMNWPSTRTSREWRRSRRSSVKICRASHVYPEYAQMGLPGSSRRMRRTSGSR